MANRYIRYDDVAINGDNAATPVTVMERDNTGSSAAVSFTATNLTALASLFLGGGTKSTSATIDTSAVIWKINAASGALTETLPPASTVPNLVYAYIKTDNSTNAVTIKGSGSENINGANTFNLTAQYKVVIIWSDGTQWYILFSN